TDPAEGAALAAAALAALTERRALTLATTHLGSLKDVASHTAGVVNASLQFDAATLTPTYRFLKGVPGRSYGLAIARRLGVAPEILSDAEARVPEAERSLDRLLAAVEERQRELSAAQTALAERTVELDALDAQLSVQQAAQASREAELRRQERDAARAGRQQARAYLLEARQLVEQALGAARTEAAAREARRLVEEGIRDQGEALEQLEQDEAPAPADRDGAIEVGDRVRLATGTAGQVLEIRGDGKLVVAIGAMKMVVDPDQATRTEGQRPAASAPPPAVSAATEPSPLEIDLRGMTGDEAEQAAAAAVDAAVLAEQPYLRIIHGMGTGVVRERVRRVVAGDRRIAHYGFAPRNQGGTGVTIVEFTP
ncbi:MAG TPA: Smr/MutS family protein, partial [Gemmatimonadales bacterium]|nr:Smr/MutS family protein [Gemmatimonadales bacterium]